MLPIYVTLHVTTHVMAALCHHTLVPTARPFEKIGMGEGLLSNYNGVGLVKQLLRAFSAPQSCPIPRREDQFQQNFDCQVQKCERENYQWVIIALFVSWSSIAVLSALLYRKTRRVANAIIANTEQMLSNNNSNTVYVNNSGLQKSPVT